MKKGTVPVSLLTKTPALALLSFFRKGDLSLCTWRMRCSSWIPDPDFPSLDPGYRIQGSKMHRLRIRNKELTMNLSILNPKNVY
jgi:hypothetical protein